MASKTTTCAAFLAFFGRQGAKATGTQPLTPYLSVEDHPLTTALGNKNITLSGLRISPKPNFLTLFC